LPLRTIAALVLCAALPVCAQERGQLDSSPAVFTVMAALNASGYDAGLDSPSNHPLRAAIRDEVARRKPPVVDQLRAFVRQRRQDEPAQDLRLWISLALLVEDPPKFAWRIRENQLPPDVASLKDALPLLERFHQEAGIDDLWRRSQPHIDQVLQSYQPPTIRVVNEVSAYLRAPMSGSQLGRRFQIFVDLLGAPNQILKLSFLDDYFLVVTHSPEPHTDDVREAYLQFLLDPITTKFAEKLDPNRGLIDYVQAAPHLADHYKQDFLLLATKSLSRAVESRLAPAARRQAMVDESMGQGYILAAHFAEQLPLYEKQEAAMRMYFPDMVKAINLRREAARLDKLEFAATRAVRKAKVVAPEPPPDLSAWEKQLEKSEEVYAARKLDQAREEFGKLLTMTADKSIHARAYFGLARIAALKNDPELAEKLFNKTLELGPPAQEKAWTLVYLGRLAWVANDREAAGGHYRAALAVEGASPKAREAAQKALQESQKN
jgi:tetratricopeptide (TPR) repeat protein